MKGLAVTVSWGMVDRGVATPLHVQVSDRIHEAIGNSSVRPGDLLPNEAGLAQAFAVSTGTVRRALEQLVRGGLLVRESGFGTRVLSGQLTPSVRPLSLFDELVAAGLVPGTTVLVNELVQATHDVRTRLRLPPAARVLHLRRVRYAAGRQLAILENWLLQDLSRAASRDLTQTGLYAALRDHGTQIRVTRDGVGARSGTREECRLLGVMDGEPLMTVDRLSFDDLGRPVEVGRHLYRADRYSYSFTVEADRP